jgi:hypothetical protein
MRSNVEEFIFRFSDSFALGVDLVDATLTLQRYTHSVHLSGMKYLMRPLYPAGEETVRKSIASCFLEVIQRFSTTLPSNNVHCLSCKGKGKVKLSLCLTN